MKLKILHLSDLHIANSSTSQDLVLTSLIKNIEEIVKDYPINILIVSGDIAFSGKEAEYVRAKEILNKIIAVCKIDLRNIFLIPGNHDVDRGKIKPGYLKWWYNFQDEASLQLIFDSDEALPKIESTKEAYYAFAQELMNKNIVVGKFGQYVHDVFVEANNLVKVKIVGLNSALFCGYDGDDLGRLAIGLEQVAYCDEKVNPKKEIVITCIHHPFRCFHLCDSPTINVIKRFSDIILSGHLHEEANSFQREGNLGDIISISAGAAYEKRLHNNSFNIIELDLESISGKVMFYKYLPNQHTWVINKDINYQNDGVFTFNFSKEFSRSEAHPQFNQQNKSCYRYTVELNFGIDTMTREKVDNLLVLLQTALGDLELQIVKIEPGSVKATFQTVVNDFDKIKFQLGNAFGEEMIRIKQFEYETSAIEDGNLDKLMLHWKISLKKEFFHQLDNTGANFLHPRGEELRLHDLFVSPSLKRIRIEKDSESRIDKVIDAKQVFRKSLGQDFKIVIYGSDSSGKTTLLKWAYFELYNKGFVPVLISGNLIKEINEKKVKELIQQELLKQYDKFEVIDVNKFDPDRLVLLIDDFHRIRFSKSKFKANLIASLNKITSNIVIAASDLLQFETYTSKSGITQNIFEGFERFVVLEFGPKARYELISKWNGIGRIGMEKNELIRSNNETENYVDTLIGKNFVPSYPIYLLTILQAKDAAISQKPEYSLHGFYYELLINESLNKAVKNKDEISLFYNYITDYCYFLFVEKIRSEPLSVEDLYKFHENYCLEYDIKVNLNVVLNTLINSKLLRLTHDDKFVSVPYKYIYYYFTAKYLANTISNSDTRKIVKSLCERVHRDEFSSIVLFLTHLSKDQFIIDQLLLNSRNLFSEFPPIKLENDVMFINDMVQKLPQQVYEPLDIDKVKQDELKQIDELEAQEKEFDSKKDVFDYDLNEDITTLDVLSKMIKAMKTIEITGQVTKKYWGSLKAPQKFELAEETYMLGLRTLSFYFSLLQEDTDDLIGYLNSTFRKRNLDKTYTKEQIDRASRNFLFGLCVRASVGIVKGVSNAIGYEKLSGTFEELNKTYNYNSVNLIDASIKLDHNNDFPWREIEKIKKNSNSHFLSKTVLQNLVINYLYIFHTTIEDKQKICSKLGIKLDQQLLIDATSTVKKGK